METNKILQGDALEKLKELPDKSVNMCMTSPPYWNLRDYNIDNQLGLEPTFEEYIHRLCNIFDEVKRVLRDDGTCWVNLGDTYWGSGAGTQYEPNIENAKEVYTIPYNSHKNTQRNKDSNYKSKSLCMIPFRFAIEMVNRGWILRNTIIWHKNNCMPSSVKDRFTVDYEYLFFFSKKGQYYFETQYEKTKAKVIEPRMREEKREVYSAKYKDGQGVKRTMGRNKRSVWTINPKPFSEAHFAVYPEELCLTPIKAGCPVGGIVLDPFFGAGTTGVSAMKQDKKFIGIELNPEYIEIAEKRLKPYLEQTKLGRNY